jgi:putative endonuclease
MYFKELPKIFTEKIEDPKPSQKRSDARRGNHADGVRGENMAAAYLETAGYRIVARNWRFHRNEIDIIAHGYGCEAVDHAKQQRIRRVAEAYLTCTKRSQADTKCRFDVVSIDDDKILLFKNAF